LNARVERIRTDLEKLTSLQRSSGGKVAIDESSGNPPRVITVRLNYPTAPGRDYPNRVQSETRVRIELLDRYPFIEPNVVIETPILHPNVYSSGKVCLGTKWMPTQGLDLLVRRLIQIITFDGSILNEASPANREALDWYRSAIRKYPAKFPTERVSTTTSEKPKIKWGDTTDSGKTVVVCPGCGGSARVPAGRSLKVTCPHCKNGFSTST
jgi:ubiquitin-protein ligase